VVKGVVSGLLGMPQSLRRITNSTGFIPEIDGLRFLAIVPVVFQHFSERILNVYPTNVGESNHLSFFLSHGHIGVYIFFAISGFILALPFGKAKLSGGKPVSLKQYFIRRVTRIEPPYLVVMTLLFVAVLVAKHESFSGMFPHYLASIFYVHRFVYGEWSPINPPAWTLEVEVTFYLIAPFITAFYFSIRNASVRRTILVSLVVIKVFVANTTNLFDGLYLTLPFLIEYFCVGILVADFFLTDQRHPSKGNGRLFDIVTLISIVVLFCTWSWDKNIIWKWPFLIALFFTFYGCLRGDRVKKFFQLPWITAIGGMCYSIYLLHLAFAEFVAAIIKKVSPFDSYIANFTLGIAFFLVGLFVVSVIFFKLIEQPCMDPAWPRQLAHFFRSKFGVRAQPNG
jgi:peptidoglycan/LPS O-acetylase OafA/YrhL